MIKKPYVPRTHPVCRINTGPGVVNMRGEDEVIIHMSELSS